MANVVASQKIDRNAFDLFILDTPFLRASVLGFFYPRIEPPLTLRGSTRAILRRRFQERQALSFAWKATEPAISTRKGDRIVTSAVRGASGTHALPSISSWELARGLSQVPAFKGSTYRPTGGRPVGCGLGVGV